MADTHTLSCELTSAITTSIELTSAITTSIELTSAITTSIELTSALIQSCELESAITTEIELTSALIGDCGVYESYLLSKVLAYYKLDETSGTDIIDSHGELTGLNVGGNLNQDGKINKSYAAKLQIETEVPFVYDYITGYIDINYSVFQLQGSFSFNMWIKPNITLASGALCTNTALDSGGGGYFLGIQARKPYIIFNSGTVNVTLLSSGVAIDDGVFSMITFVRDVGVSIKIYINALEVATVADSGVSIDYSHPDIKSLIGASYDPNEDEYGKQVEANIDELSFFSIALDQDNIDSLYNSGNGLAFENL